MSLEKIVAISNKYGANPEFVLAGGGNTSYKDSKYLYIKGSGTGRGGWRGGGRPHATEENKTKRTETFTKRITQEEKVLLEAYLEELRKQK